MSSDIKPLRGVVGAPVTPFKDDLSLDTDTLRKVIDFFVREKVDCFAIMMHIGENVKMSPEERRTVAEVCIDQNAGRVPIYIHVSESWTAGSVDFALHAADAGADGVVLLPPYVWQAGFGPIVDHFGAVSDALPAGKGIVAYNNPRLTGSPIDGKLFRALLERCPNLVGFKDASFNMRTFTDYSRIAEELRPEGFSLMPGVEYLVPSAPIGGTGSFSGLGGFAPRLVRELQDLANAGEYEKAWPLQKKAAALFAALDETGLPGPMNSTAKIAMEIMGRPVGESRLPRNPVTPEIKERLRQRFDELGILDSEPHGW